MKALFIFFNLIVITIAAMASSINFKTNVEVRDENIELGEIAQVESEELSQLVLGKSPQIGETYTWSAEELSKKLRPYEEVLKDFKIKLPSFVKITRLDLEFSKQAIENKIKATLKTLIPSSWEVKIEVTQNPQWPVLSQNARWNVVSPAFRPKGPSQFEIVIEDLNISSKRMWINARAEYFANVVVSQNQLNAREKVSTESLKIEKRNVTYIADALLELNDLEESLAKFNIPAGTILTKNMIDKEFAVKFGEEVEMRVGDSNFTVTAKAIAQQNAHVGDSIKVRTNQNSKVISGVVIGKGKIKVSL